MNRDVKLHMAGTFTLYAKLCFFSRFWLAHLVKNGLIHMYLSRLLIRKLRTPISQNTFYQERNDYPNYS